MEYASLSSGGKARTLAAAYDRDDEKGVFHASLELTSGKVVVDHLLAGIAGAAQSEQKAPIQITPLPSFDPIKAGWPLVFHDEFNGKGIDFAKWFVRTGSPEFVSLDGEGHLKIRFDFLPGTRELQTAGLWSREKFKYGYFEARVRFTRQPGCWAAFWLYGTTNNSMTVDGFEVDIFEDYYTRPEYPGGPFRNILDHNRHVTSGGHLKSWNYNSQVPGSLDKFHVIGCKWTPFEISYYMDGKLIQSEAVHSPWKSVTFDSINYGFGTTPLHVIVSGQIGSFSKAKVEHGKFPEEYFVDYVRVYGFPQNAIPSLSWGRIPPETAEEGEKLVMEVKPDRKVKTVFLFDHGFLLDWKQTPPYRFEVPLTEDYYSRTSYCKPGRSGKPLTLNTTLFHSFNAVAVDENGNAGESDSKLVMISRPGNKPYEGKAAEIPGTILPGRYDEGGYGIAYYDVNPENRFSRTWREKEGVDCQEKTLGSVCTGEWIKYTVNIRTAGNYEFKIKYGTALDGQPMKLKVFLDGQSMTEIPIHGTGSWDPHKQLSAGVRLPEGRHVLTLFFIGTFNLGALEVLRK